EWLTACRQDDEAWADPQQTVGQHRACFDQVLAVVHDKERAARSEELGQRVLDRTARLFAHAERGGDGLRHQARVSLCRQLDEPDAIGECIELPVRDLERQAGLADARRTREHNEAGLADESSDFGEIMLAPHEAVETGRQVAVKLRRARAFRAGWPRTCWPTPSSHWARERCNRPLRPNTGSFSVPS